MNILAIDTSCDDTSVAVVENLVVKSNIVSSQVRYHKKFGGVVPFLAARLHQERIDAVIEMALSRAGLKMKDVGAIAVTEGPGLAPALQVGIKRAKELSLENKLPLYAVNHMAGHIASCFIGQKVEFPALALLVSGGHTELVYMEKFGSFEILGETLDDAVGESFDKVARMLGLGYPGGRLVFLLAKKGNPEAYSLPVPMLRSKDLNFSYSGLKNAVRLLIMEVEKESPDEVIPAEKIANICASFQKAALTSLIKKLEKALEEHPNVNTVLLGGGVANNTVLRSMMRKVTKKLDMKLLAPSRGIFCHDNAAMIGAAAVLGIENGLKPIDIEVLDRKPALRLSEA